MRFIPVEFLALCDDDDRTDEFHIFDDRGKKACQFSYPSEVLNESAEKAGANGLKRVQAFCIPSGPGHRAIK